MTNVSSCITTNIFFYVTNASCNLTNTSCNVTNIKVGFKAAATGFPLTPLLLLLVPTLSWIIQENHNFKEIQAQVFLKSQFQRNSHARYLEITINLNTVADYLEIFKFYGSFCTFFQSSSSLEALNVSTKAWNWGCNTYCREFFLNF